MCIIVFMDEENSDGWDRFFVRLGTLRLVGGVPAMRTELRKHSDDTLSVLSKASIATVIKSGVKQDERAAAFEIAATISDIFNDRKEYKDD